MTRLLTTLALIDEANAADPNLDVGASTPRPAALVYGERMTAALARLAPEASELLQIAVRAQHIRRWQIPRSSFPMDRAGYHRWRNELKSKHAQWAGEIMAGSGYSEAEIARTGALIRKEGLKSDPEAQTLEDAACLVFLEHFAADFAGRHDKEKIDAIMRKTLAKMSDQGRGAIADLPLPREVRDVIARTSTGGEPAR